MLISFCGIDGAGKTTQIDILSSSLTSEGYKTYITKQPTPWYRSDRRLRSLLDGDIEYELPILRELALFAATDRLRQYNIEIEPKLRDGHIVLCDRYVYSSYTYFPARGLKDITWLKEINKYVSLPNITFYIDIDLKTSVDRIIRRDGKITKREEINTSIMRQVRQNFLERIWGEHEQFFIINGERSIQEIAEEIYAYTADKLKKLSKVGHI